MDTKLPSRFQIGDVVKVNYMVSGADEKRYETATIKKVHFSEGKIHYDVSVKFLIPRYEEWKDIDSIYVEAYDE